MHFKRYFVEGLAQASYLIGDGGEAAVIDPKRLAEIPHDRALAVMCGSGYRSSIAASLLQARGFAQVENVMGGMAAYLEADCPEWHPADLVFGAE